MKFTATIYRTETKTVQLFAATPHEAMQALETLNPGWHADSLSELGDGDVVGDFWELYSKCHHCEKPIFHGEERILDKNCRPWCQTCLESLDSDYEPLPPFQGPGLFD